MHRGPERVAATFRRGRAFRWRGVILFVWVAGLPAAFGSTPRAGDEATGRGLQLLQEREAALGNQSAQAARTARLHGRMLYRLLLHEAAERHGRADSGAGVGEATPGAVPGGRAISLGVAVLERDLREVQVLRDELGRVHEERQAAPLPVTEKVDPSTESIVPRMRAPVAGTITSSYGVARDEATGGWLFRTATGFSAKAGAAVVAPADGRVVRVAEDAGGGMALVLTHAGGWTTVLSGLGAVAVSLRETVHGGAIVGTVSAESSVPLRVEVWHGRAPVDPLSVFGVPTKVASAPHVARDKAR